MKEVTLISKLDHPNIIKLIALYEDQKRFYLVTELCTGGDLYDEIIILKKLEEAQAACIIKQITGAISYLHKKKIVHRDIKLENILLDDRMNLKVADFGFAVNKNVEKLK